MAISLLVSWLTTASSTFSRSSSFSPTSTVTTSFHMGSVSSFSALVAARDGRRAAASRIVFAATNAAGALPEASSFGRFVAEWTSTETRSDRPVPVGLSLVPTDPPRFVSSMVICSETCAGSRPSGDSIETLTLTASPRCSRCTVGPKNSTYPVPQRMSCPMALLSAVLRANSWQRSAGGPSPMATPGPSLFPGQSLPPSRSAAP